MNDVTAGPSILIIDVETSQAGEARDKSARTEIIEIGAVWVRPDGTLIASFRDFVRPSEKTRLSAECLRAIGVRQADIDAAEHFPVVAARLGVFVRQHAAPSSHWATWGSTSQRRLLQACARHKIGVPVGLPHVNAKQLFARHQQLNREVSLRQACALARLGEVPGVRYRALNGAMAISWLLPWVFGGRPLARPAGRA